ncbi:MAG: hypothetical protein QOJ02_3054 [Acidobacteriota bacterium]|jgi:hypothetical protein|nr:hypothetical protein [Acidobacteriota bacterium]
MIKSKLSATATVFLLITAAILLTTGFASRVDTIKQVNTRFNIKDMPEYGLSIIGPSDSSYDSMVSALLNREPNPIVEAFRPFSIFIKNTTKQTMVGCMLKWELMQPDGKVLTEKHDYIALWSLTGTAITNTSEAVIRPNATQFFTPSYLEVNQSVSIKGSSSRDTASPEIAEYLKQRRSELGQFISITVSLDGAFFDDGTFVGPDTAGFFLKVLAIRNARHDLFKEIEQKVQRKANNNEIFQQMEAVASAPEVELTSNSTPSDYYNNYKREAALELLRARTASGDAKAIEKILEKLQKPWPALRKI